MVISQYCVTVI